MFKVGVEAGQDMLRPDQKQSRIPSEGGRGFEYCYCIKLTLLKGSGIGLHLIYPVLDLQ